MIKDGLLQRRRFEPNRRTVLQSGLAALAVSAIASPWKSDVANAQSVSAKRVYVATGAKVPTILSDPDYEKAYRSVFGAHSLTFELNPARATMLSNIMATDIVYLNVHSNKSTIIAGDGQPIDIGTFIQAFRKSGRGPSLIVVSGCNTLKIDTKTSFPRALGIEDAAKPRAYIGFDRVVMGGIADNYFRVFFGHWLKPRGDNTYRTLEEARSDTIDFVERKLGQASDPNAGKMMKFAPLTPAIGRQLSIFGNAGLRLPDLEGQTNVPPPWRNETTAPVQPPQPTNAAETSGKPKPGAGGVSADDVNKMFRN